MDIEIYQKGTSYRPRVNLQEGYLTKAIINHHQKKNSNCRKKLNEEPPHHKNGKYPWISRSYQKGNIPFLQNVKIYASANVCVLF